MAAVTTLLRKEEFDALRDNLKIIKDSMDRSTMDELADQLYELNLINSTQYQDFIELQLTSDKANKVLSWLFANPSSFYSAFVSFCEEYYPEVYELLHITGFNSLPAEGAAALDEENSAEQSQVLVPSLLPPSSLIDLEVQPAIMAVDVLPVSSTHIMRKMKKYHKVYSTSFPVRGIALLIVNTQFTAKSKLPNRNGAQYDLKNLSNLFHHLRYNVRILENQPKAVVDREITALRNDPDLARYGSMVLGLSSHGGDKACACSDGEKIYLNDIIDLFDSAHCPLMAGKPKFLFFDASSGWLMDKGVPLDKPLNPPAIDVELSQTKFLLNNINFGSAKKVDANELQMQSLHISSGVKKLNMIPEKSDFIIAMSTFEGHVSWRRNSHGCWFSRVLVEVFMQYSCDHHIVELLKFVKQKISQVETKRGHKQVCVTMDSLLKRFYFFPGVDSD